MQPDLWVNNYHHYSFGWYSIRIIKQIKPEMLQIQVSVCGIHCCGFRCEFWIPNGSFNCCWHKIVSSNYSFVIGLFCIFFFNYYLGTLCLKGSIYISLINEWIVVLWKIQRSGMNKFKKNKPEGAAFLDCSS